MMHIEKTCIEEIEDNIVNEIQQNIETSTEVTVIPPLDDLAKNPPNPRANEKVQISGTSSVDTGSFTFPPIETSVTYIDTNPSRKYPITLKQARMRVLKAIIKAKKRKLSAGEES